MAQLFAFRHGPPKCRHDTIDLRLPRVGGQQDTHVFCPIKEIRKFPLPAS
ncbi:hypothetical protein ABI_03320 [Asticcacaulis biprosthecium C19]|uniref:Uncharacterized protein n=1 Tax=Asticcacaulis biprosthecium C19 TaxID=715226 RepID=F4QJ68_9CAUL|nr:hypothetical protein ABI_03320 [Asticcacaulis biprosthecium C19]